MVRLALLLLVMTSLCSCAKPGSNGEWTDTNKLWFAAAVAGQAADVWSTEDGLDRGCTEANPIYGSSPPVGSMLLIKGAVLSAQYAVIEYLVEPESRESARNWVYGTTAVLGFGIALRNSNVGCY